MDRVPKLAPTNLLPGFEHAILCLGQEGAALDLYVLGIDGAGIRQRHLAVDPETVFAPGPRLLPSEFVMVGKRYDASSCYIALACLQGRAFREAIISFRKDSGEAHLDYLVITLTNVTISSYDLADDEDGSGIEDQLALSFEKINIRYTVQNDDGSAGGEHEIEYDVSAGA